MKTVFVVYMHDHVYDESDQRKVIKVFETRIEADEFVKKKDAMLYKGSFCTWEEFIVGEKGGLLCRSN